MFKNKNIINLLSVNIFYIYKLTYINIFVDMYIYKYSELSYINHHRIISYIYIYIYY